MNTTFEYGSTESRVTENMTPYEVTKDGYKIYVERTSKREWSDDPFVSDMVEFTLVTPDGAIGDAFELKQIELSTTEDDDDKVIPRFHNFQKKIDDLKKKASNHKAINDLLDAV